MTQQPRKSKKHVARIKQRAQAARQALSALRQRLPLPVKRALRRTTRWTLHSMLGVLISIVLIFAAAYLWLPLLGERKAEIATYLSTTLGNPVTLDTLDTYWDGLNPGVRVRGVGVQSAATGDPAFRLKELRLSLSWLALLTGRLEINSLRLVEPSLTIERQPNGKLRVSGLDSSAMSATEDTDFSNLLLAQKEMIIENGQLLWLDRRAGANADRLFVKRVELTMRNDGDRHQLEFRADFPADVCKDCQVRATIRGNPVHDPSWRGKIDVQARALSVRGLPIILRDLLPAGVEGRFDVNLTSKWRAARPEAIEGRLAVLDLRLPMPGEPHPLIIQALDSNIAWHGDSESWQLDLARLRLGLTRAPWLAGRLQLEVKPERLRLEVEHVELADLTAFAISLPREHRLLDWLRAAQPAGDIDRLRVELNGPFTAPSRYRAHGELRAIRFGAHERMPGVRGLSGELTMSEEGGEFRLDSGDLKISVPRVLTETVALQRLESHIRWRQNPEDWFVQAQDIVLNARDGRAHGDIELRLPKDPKVSPVLKLEIDFSDGDVSQVARYYPLILPEALRTWLERSVISGRVTEGHAVYHGALANFPFRDGKGRFEVRAHVRSGVLDYLPGWTPLHDIDADLFFTGTSMSITATHARVRSLEVGRTVVVIEDFKAPGGALVMVNARVTGALQETLGVLADSKTPLFASLVPIGTRAEGNGSLTLDIRIPTRTPKISGIAGFYRFQNNNLALPFRALRIDNINGGMEFNEAGLRAGKLHARMLGSELVLEALPASAPTAAGRIEVRGSINQAGLAQVFGPSLAPYLVGNAPWQLHLQPQPARAGMKLRFESDLSGLEVRLPAPLAKVQGEPLTLVMSTQVGASDIQMVDMQAGTRVQGKLAFRHEPAGWKFARGRIGIGEPVTQLPSQAGLHLSARLPTLNIDQWAPLLRSNPNDSAQSDWSDILSRLSAEVEALEASGREFGRLSLDIAKADGNWRGRLQGDAISGQIAISRPASTGLPLVVGNVAAPGRSTIHLTLEKLLLPSARKANDEAQLDPRTLPPLHIRSQSFTFADVHLGELEFSALPATQGWKIASLKLTRPESRLTASGLWEIDSRAQHISRLDASLTSSNFGSLLEALGYPGEVVGGKLTLQSNWSWLGAPGAFQLAKTDGDLTINLNKGRVPKISPGAGRLLGALDLRSITRYLSLDFSNVFSKGLTFDRMSAKVAVQQGNAYTRDLAIRTPGADLEIAGRIGLAARDLDLDIGVTPHLMEELALTGSLIGGPVVGAAVVVLHNLIKKPFEESTRIKYTVKGGWIDPVVTRLAPPAAPANDDQQ